MYCEGEEGGHHQGREYYSLYQVRQGSLVGLQSHQLPHHETLVEDAGGDREGADTEKWTMMEKLSVLGTESVIIVALMATTSVFLLGEPHSLSNYLTVFFVFLATIVFLYLGIKVKY